MKCSTFTLQGKTRLPAKEDKKVSVPFTVNELYKLGARGGLGCFAPAVSFPVSDLVAGDLPVLAAEGRGLPPQHDALREDRDK